MQPIWRWSPPLQQWSFQTGEVLSSASELSVFFVNWLSISCGPWSDIPGNFSSLAPHTRVSKVADRTGKQRKVFRNIELIDPLPLPTPYQGKFSEAREVLEAAARRNGVTLSEHLLSPDPGSDSKRAAVDEK